MEGEVVGAFAGIRRLDRFATATCVVHRHWWHPHTPYLIVKRQKDAPDKDIERLVVLDPMPSNWIEAPDHDHIFPALSSLSVTLDS